MSDKTPSVCVFCGARPGRDPAHIAAAEALGSALAERGWRLVYGAGDAGVMGAVSAAVHRTGGRMLGVIPDHLVGRETARHTQAGPGADPGADPGAEVIVTQTMHERKTLMFTNSDAIVLLPGGAGSLDEFFEVLTWAQLGLHAKPILLLDVNGYWAPLRALIDHVIAEGFADPSLAAIPHFCADVPELVAALQQALIAGAATGG